TRSKRDWSSDVCSSDLHDEKQSNSNNLQKSIYQIFQELHHKIPPGYSLSLMAFILLYMSPYSSWFSNSSCIGWTAFLNGSLSTSLKMTPYSSFACSFSSSTYSFHISF